MAAEAAAPLLAREDGTGAEGRSGGGGATWAQTLGNVVVSIVGTGVLGLPYAFRTAGWLAGSLGVAAAGCATLYCMLLLVSTLPYTALLHLSCLNCLICLPCVILFTLSMSVLLFFQPIISVFFRQFCWICYSLQCKQFIQIGMSCSGKSVCPSCLNFYQL
jgi:proton-coupled amino acid transporter